MPWGMPELIRLIFRRIDPLHRRRFASLLLRRVWLWRHRRWFSRRLHIGRIIARPLRIDKLHSFPVSPYNSVNRAWQKFARKQIGPQRLIADLATFIVI